MRDNMRLVEPEPVETTMTFVELRYGSGEVNEIVLREDRKDEIIEYQDSYILTRPESGQVITVFKRHLAAISQLTKVVKIPAKTSTHPTSG